MRIGDRTAVDVGIGSAFDVVPRLGLLVQLVADGTLDLIENLGHGGCYIGR